LSAEQKNSKYIKYNCDSHDPLLFYKNNFMYYAIQNYLESKKLIIRKLLFAV